MGGIHMCIFAHLSLQALLMFGQKCRHLRVNILFNIAIVTVIDVGGSSFLLQKIEQDTKNIEK